jgi:RNA polymerase sigma factor (sigma-70 family)
MEPLAAAMRSAVEDAAAFDAVFASQFDRLLSRTVGQVYDSEIAVDIVSETLAEAFIQRARFRGSTDAELVAWLNTIAKRKVAGFYRKAAVERRALNKLGIEPPELTQAEHREVLDRIDAPAMREAIRAGLMALSESQREALTLRIVDELPYPSLAAQLGIPEEAARQRVARALQKLRKKLGKHQSLLEETS